MQPSKRTGWNTFQKNAGAIAESYLTIELRTVSDTAMRIQGYMTSSHLQALISVTNIQL